MACVVIAIGGLRLIKWIRYNCNRCNRIIRVGRFIRNIAIGRMLFD